VSDTSKRVKRKRNPKSKLKSAAKPTRKRPPASIRLSLRPLEIALLDLRLQYLNEQAVKFQFKCPKSRADVIRSLLQSVIETSRLLKKRCNDTSPLSDWKCRALCLPIWSTLAQSGGYSDQSGQLDEIVGRHRQGELEVEFPNAT